MARIAIEDLLSLSEAALRSNGANEIASRSTAAGLVSADIQGISSHGVSRLPQYASHLRSGRVRGDVLPLVLRHRGGTVLIDAREGFAFPALELAASWAMDRISSQGVVFAAVTNSHHFGAAAHHLSSIAKAGLVGFAFSNSPAAIPAWGGKRPLFGTNPIAAVFPRKEAPPIVIDLSLSQVARGKLMLAAREGVSIPVGWALDREGEPTTDPSAALDGMMCPMGGVKGATLALAVELLCCALTGAAFGFEADSFFVEKGNRPRLGQALWVIDPDALSGQSAFLERVETLAEAMLEDEGVRLPGDARHAQRIVSSEQGLIIPDALLAEIRVLARDISP